MMGEAQGKPDIELLVSLLKEQQELFRQLRFLAERQRSLVLQEDAEPLLDVLARRQKLVDGLVALNARLAPYRAQWSEIYAGLDDARRRMVADMLEEANGSLTAVLRNDSHDSATLAARQRGIGDQLAAVDNGARACAAYGAGGASKRSNLTDSRV